MSDNELPADREPMARYVAAINRFNDKVIQAPAVDGVTVTDSRLQIFTDGSCRIELEWTKTTEGYTPSEKLLNAIFGAGETALGFDSLEALRNWFKEKGVWK